MRLKPGDFVRVKAESDYRPGQDGMVIDANNGDGETVGLMFGYDRHNQLPRNLNIPSSAEAWRLSELDLASATR